MNTSQLLRYSFLAFLFLLPFQTAYLLREPSVGGEKWQYGTIGVYGTDICLFLLIFLVAFVWKKNIDLRFMIFEWGIFQWFLFLKSKIINQKSETLLVMFLLWTGLSVIWAGDKWLAFSSFITFLLAVGFFFLARSMLVQNIKKVVFVLLCAGVIQSGIGIGQFLYQKSIDSSILGMNSHTAYEAGSSVLKIDSGRFLRAYGTFSHPNILGGFLGVILLLGMAYYVLYVRYERSWKILADIVFLLVGSVIILLGLILSFSRSAWLGAVIGILALGVMVFFRKEWGGQVKFLKILFAFGLASVIFGSLLHEQISPRFDTATIEREGSVTERVQSLRDASTIIGEGNILLGTGISNFTAEMIRLQPGRSVWTIQPAHNVFVLIFAELGMVGFVLFVIFLGSILFRMKSSFQKKESIIFCVALFVLVPSLFFDHFLWSSHFGLFFFFLLLGLVSRR